MKTRTRWWNWVVMAVLAITLQSPLGIRAQDAQVAANSQDPQDADDANSQDPPSRVARLNYMQGSVSLQPGGENDWVTAVLNRPLVTGDNLWADEDSRAEVHIGSTALRLGPKTGITLLEVSDSAAQIRLAQGSLIVKVRHVDDEDSYEIDTPNVAFVVMQPGDYRVDVDADGTRTQVTVWLGRGQVTGGGSSYNLVAGQHVIYTGTDQLNYESGQIPAKDGLDSWALDRDRREDQSDSANYVSRETTGYEDLDQYGSWSDVAGYGTCWQPTEVAVGWAPYRFGHWASVGPWGWTWIEDEPWGFAPFHYGRWAFAGNAWVWVPGPRVVRPVYAPALVAWIGGGPGAKFSFGRGLGWIPLAPGEVFIPGYRVSHAYVNNVNLTNTRVDVSRVTSVYNNAANMTYANRSVNGGVTIVSRETFVNARPVAGNVVSVPARELAAAPISRTVAIEPVRSGGVASSASAAKPPAAVTSRIVVAVRTPAAMPGSHSRSPGQGDGHMNQQLPLVRPAAPGRPVPGTREPQTNDGFRSFGQPGSGTDQAKPKPRVWEAQGAPEPQRSAAATRSENRNTRPLPPSSHPTARQVAPVQQKTVQQEKEQVQKSSWQQPRPVPAAAHPQQNSHPSADSHASAPPKK
jgi:hypothetical protein